MLAMEEHNGDENLRGSSRQSITPYVHEILYCIIVPNLKASAVALVALGSA
jgi:hypothetical protein